MERTAIVIGATGLVGRELVRQLLDHPQYTRVLVLTRRMLEWEHPKLRQERIDFEHPDPALIRGDDLYCALGTTLKKAGSEAAQYRIDCTYPYEIARIARQNGVWRCLLVSSIGADAKSNNFYLRTKGELEQRIDALNFELFVAARPSLLLGDREEFRFGEKAGMVLERIFRPLIPAKYKGIQAAQVAKALIHVAFSGQTGRQVVESDRLQSVR